MPPPELPRDAPVLDVLEEVVVRLHPLFRHDLRATVAHRFEGRGTLRASVTGWWGNLQARDADLALRGFGGVWGERKLEGVDADISATEEFAKLKATVSKGRATAAGNTFEDLVLALSLDKQSLVVSARTFTQAPEISLP
jgi:hypothetical protein